MIRRCVHLLPILLLVFGCSSAYATTLTIFAASSLSEALRDIARSYESGHPTEQLLLNFAGSQTLATQIEQGAPADLFISANRAVMKRLKNQDLVENSQALLSNRLVLAARRDLQPALTGIKQLARPDLLLAIGNPQVPVGGYTRQLFAELAADPTYGQKLVNRIEANVVSEENRVKAIVAKLLLGEVDAGIVYQSDLAVGKARQLNAVPLPVEHNPLAVYPLATVRGGRTAESFVAFLHGGWARRIFARYGFSLLGEP